MTDTGRQWLTGFEWGPMEVIRTAYIEGKGRALRISTDTHSLEVFVSEKGRSIRCWLDGKPIEVNDD